MANLQDRNPHNLDGDSNDPDYIHTNGNVDPRRAASYRDGYVHGRVSERHLEEESLRVRDNNNAARGLLIGIALTSLLGLGVLAWYLFFNRPVEESTPVIVPVPSASPSPAVSQEQNRTTVIERQGASVPQIIPVPQQAAPAPQQGAPKVNITIPNSTQQPAPARQDTNVNVAPPQSSTQTQTETTRTTSPSNLNTQTAPGTGNDTTTSGTQNQTGTSSSGNSNTGSTTNSNP
ncbi:MAG: hypothetical protein KME08_06900 [Aphanothece sp. CMT-3BRIN-NPC111]|jgi:hypothetical protein|nr:hypothetical protein [Aphanothece sp. CMT-3BRIN-NPC111]